MEVRSKRFLLKIATIILFLSFFCSIANATTETRYFQKETWDATYKKLTTTQDDTAYENYAVAKSQYVSSAQWGIRVWLNNTASDNKTEYKELTGGTPQAIVTRTAERATFGLQSNATYSLPLTTCNASDALVVKAYAILFYINNGGNSGWTQLGSSFRTEALNANFINSSGTVTYYTKFTNYTGSIGTAAAFLAYDGNSETLDYYPTRIANLVWNPAPSSGTNLTVSGLISLTFAIAKTRTAEFSRDGTIPLAFTISNERSISMNAEGTIPLSFSIINERSVGWNLLGLIPLSLSVSNARIIVWSLLGTIPLAFSFDGLMVQNPYVVLLNIFGIIPLAFTIVTVTTLPSVDEMPILFIGMLTCAILVGLCILMMRRRKQT